MRYISLNYVRVCTHFKESFTIIHSTHIVELRNIVRIVLQLGYPTPLRHSSELPLVFWVAHYKITRVFLCKRLALIGVRLPAWSPVAGNIVKYWNRRNTVILCHLVARTAYVLQTVAVRLFNAQSRIPDLNPQVLARKRVWFHWTRLLAHRRSLFSHLHIPVNFARVHHVMEIIHQFLLLLHHLSN